MASDLLKLLPMYLKMMLGGQLLEQRPVQNANLYTGDYLQTTMRDMIRRHEAEIDRLDDQPQFILEENPAVLPKPRRMQTVFRRVNVFFKLLLG
jgi:hypothetical protein